MKWTCVASGLQERVGYDALITKTERRSSVSVFKEVGCESMALRKPSIKHGSVERRFPLHPFPFRVVIFTGTRAEGAGKLFPFQRQRPQTNVSFHFTAAWLEKNQVTADGSTVTLNEAAGRLSDTMEESRRPDGNIVRNSSSLWRSWQLYEFS